MKKNFENILVNELKPGVGCTEPAAIAFAAASLKKYLKDEIKECSLIVNPMLYKNAKYVLIPNTKYYGLEYALALGFNINKETLDLEIFKDLKNETLDKAIEFINNKKIDIKTNTTNTLFIEIKATTKSEEAMIRIEQKHTHISKIEINGEIIFEKEIKANEEDVLNSMKNTSLKEIIEFAETVDKKLFYNIEAGIKMNKIVSEAGLINETAFNLGKGYKKLIDNKMICDDLVNEVKMKIAGACDCRMGGLNFPVMTAIGSGNQGIGIILPSVFVAEKLEIDKERMNRAIIISLLVTAYVKSHTGRLSPICGNTIIGIANAVSIAWMLEGNYSQMVSAANNVIANITGVICDGAKGGCSLKIADGAGTGVMSALLSINDTCVDSNDGILSDDFETTILNFSKINTDGMSNMNAAIIEKM